MDNKIYSKSVNITLKKFLNEYKEKILEDNKPIVKEIDIKIKNFDITEDAQKVKLYKYNFHDTYKEITSNFNINEEVLINSVNQEIDPLLFGLSKANVFNVEKIKNEIIISKFSDSEDEMNNYEKWYILKRSPYFLILNVDRIINKLNNPNKFSKIDKCILGLEKINEEYKAKFNNEYLQDFLKSTILNENQIIALKKMISAENVALIKGPPGTGKTTLIEIFLHYSLLTDRNRRIIFATNLHSSMDSIIEKVNKNNFLKHKKILRLTKRPHSRRTPKHKILSKTQLAHVYVTTLASQRMNCILNDKQYWFNDLKPILIIDEASASNIISILSHTSNIEKIIVIGDDKQLYPIYNHKYYQYFKSQNYEREFNYFFINSFFNFIYDKNMNNATMLNINYRSTPHIVNFINNFYDNKLIANDKSQQVSFEIFKSNDYESSKNTLKYQINQKNLTIRNTIFMCEYKKIINDLNILLNKKIFNTTTSIQGNEATNVCIFLAKNFGTNDYRSQLDYRTINVAISRAKKNVYIFSYDKIIDKHLIDKSNYWSDIKVNGKYLSITNLISSI